MADWSTRALCLARMVQRHVIMHEAQGKCAVAITAADGNVSGITDPAAKVTCEFIIQALQEISFFMRWYLDTNIIYDPNTIVPYFLDNYTVETADGDPYELSWEKIVAAWADANTTGRLFTILSIDAMRKEIWNEPVTSFALAAGMDDL